MRRSLCAFGLLFSGLLSFAPLFQVQAGNRAPNPKFDNDLLNAAASGNTAAVRRLAYGRTEVRDEQYGFTPLMWASWRANIGTMRELIKRGANVKARTNSAQPAPIILRPYSFVKTGEQTFSDGSLTTFLGVGYAAYNDGITPLLLAAASGSALAVQTLLDKGANPNAATVSGETPLDAAAAAGYLPSVQLLLKRGAKVNSRDVSGGTPLMNAVLQGHKDIVKTLLDAGAETNGNWRGYSPHRIAAMMGHREIAGMLGMREVSRILSQAAKRDAAKKVAPQRDAVKIISSDGSVQVVR